jgi:hypothetical protein
MAMAITDQIPPPRTLVDELRDIPLGSSLLIAQSVTSVRSTLTRIKNATGWDYTTRPEPDGIRVWRLR